MFRRVFSNYLQKSVEFAYANNMGLISECKLPEKVGDAIAIVNSGKLQAKVARSLLDHYQGFLLEESKVYGIAS